MWVQKYERTLPPEHRNTPWVEPHQTFWEWLASALRWKPRG